MSLVERLFPPSGREQIRTSEHVENMPDRQPAKRRRLGSTYSSRSVASSAVDSGYSSEEAYSPKHILHAPKLEPLPVKLERQRANPTDSTRKRQRLNSVPNVSSHTPPGHFQTQLTRMNPVDQQRPTKSRPTRPSRATSQNSARDADLEIISAQQQIALARQRLHSYSGAVPMTHQDETNTSYAAGPQGASSMDLHSRVFDSYRTMDNERNMIHALFNAPQQVSQRTPQQASQQLPQQSPQQRPMLKPELPIALGAEEPYKVEAEFNFPGFAMPANFQEEELELSPGTYFELPVDSGFEDFFKLDEASTSQYQTIGCWNSRGAGW